ncbi:cation:proton antiporter [Akkermansia sp. N21116]|jgi:CPA2 family monovalent cation:H+ antiporter-2|uniref:cation:proton antiporter domain-containing protein n=1 Tax=Akkermansia sp. N21116 TaxID=3040764 RepID=UPI00244EA608|nr:cation:proton antiporter [Akkermansia sp. N21116]WPX40390.1 cation:proton antiporter [Akkermansia sp. N21116]
MLVLLAHSSPNLIPPFFVLLTLVFLTVVGLSLLLARFRQSMMGGYFLCGAILANCGILSGIPGAEESINSLAEIGIILLMFALGIEFSMDQLRLLRKTAFIGGSIQMGLCMLFFGFGLHLLMKLPLADALVIGAIIGLSSTAVSLKSFHEFGLSGTSGARMALGIALFQDIFAVMLVAVMPQIFAPGETVMGTFANVGVAAGKGVVFLIGAWLIGKYILPRLMLAVSRTKSRELFTMTVLAICSGIAMMASLLGLSLALGAFIAGLVVSGSYYSHRVLSEILPFRDIFLTIFFVSAGLLINVNELWEHLGTVTLITVSVLVIKLASCLVASWALNVPGRMGIMASTSLMNVGEFSLVLLPFMNRIEPVAPAITNNLFAIAAVSMGLTPVFMKIASRLAPVLTRVPGFGGSRRKMTTETLTSKLATIQDHAIICGYGPVGQRLHHDLEKYGIACIIVDLNADTVKRLLNQGVTAILGDIQHSVTMDLAGVAKARLIAFTFPDIAPALSTYPVLMSVNPDIHVIARAKFPSEVARLKIEGIASVIHDEVETGGAAIRKAHQIFDIIPEETQA